MFARIATTAAFALALLIASRTARADEAPQPPAATPDKTGASEEQSPRVHIDAEPAIAIPFAPLATATGPGIGGLVGGGYTLSDRWELVGHAGYLAGASTSTQVAGVSVSSSLSYAPLLGGVRYYFVDPGVVRPYLMVEAGPVLVSSSVSAGSSDSSGSSSASSLQVGGAASLGLQLDIIDVRAALFNADVGHAGNSASTLLTLGFRFAAL